MHLQCLGQIRIALLKKCACRCCTVKWYEMGKLSQSKAAELTGLSRQEFLDALYRFNVSPYQVTPDELREEMTDA